MPDALPPGAPPHPNAPSRGAVALAYAGVVVAGLLGATIGWGLVDTGCDGDCGAWLALGALVGALAASVGAGVVAVLMLRAMSEWGSHPPGGAGPAAAPGGGQAAANLSRRKPSA